MYLVTTEADDGTWSDEPEGFDSIGEAKNYIAELRSALLPGYCFVIYYCDLLESYHSTKGPKAVEKDAGLPTADDVRGILS